MLSNLIRSRCPHFKFSFPIGNGKEIDLPLLNIQFVEADGTTSHFQMGEYNRHRVTITQSIGACETRLKEYAFVRIHRKCLVNFSWVEKVILDNEWYCVLYNGEKLIISRRRRKEFMDQLKEYKLDRLLLIRNDVKPVVGL